MTIRLAAAVALAALLASARPIAQQAWTEEELTVSPYALLHGPRDYVERIERHEALAAVAEKSGDVARAARHLAVVCQMRDGLTGDRTLAWPSCVRARELADRHDVLDVKVFMQNAVATVRNWSLNFKGAAEAAREAIALGAALRPGTPEYHPVASAHHNLGSALAELGRFDDGRRELGIARDQCRAAGNALCAAMADLYLCRMQAMSGDFTAARAACDVARAEASIDDDVFVLMNHEWMVATIESLVGRPQASLAALQRGWTHAQSRGAEGMRPVFALMMVDALVRVQRFDEAERWQRGLEEGLGSKRIPLPFGPQISLRRGQLEAAAGRLEAAEAAFTIGSRSFIHEMSLRSFMAGARIAVLRGNLDGARDSLEKAIKRIEAGRTNVTGATLRTSYLAMHANAYRALAGVRYAAEGDAAGPAMLEIAEAGRARGLRDALASAQVAGQAAAPLTAAGIQDLLGPADVLIEYLSTDERLLAVTVTRDRIVATALPGAGTAAELATRVDFFSALVQEADEASLEKPAARLYEDLLAQPLAQAGADARTLIIAADGPLHRLPFDAIGSPRVIERWDVVTAPSASVLAQPSGDARPSGVLVVAASANAAGLAPLTAAAEEAGAIRSRIAGPVTELSGTRATLEGVTAQALDQFAVLHFASHAVVNDERPLRSALMLSGINGEWTAEDIYRKKLRADLVVLSACSTAAGASTPGEGVMSLSRAFLSAGARATVATLWDVADAPGPIFADVFYRRLAAGDAVGAAAAGARRELRRRGAPPRAWAAYVVAGHPGARVAVDPALDRRTLAAGVTGGLAVLLLGAAIFLRTTTRVARPALAGTAVALGALAIALQVGMPGPGGNLVSSASRSGAATSVTVTRTDRELRWTPTPSADAYVVEQFDAAGVRITAAEVTTTSFELAAATDGWVRVAARRTGQHLAHSAVIPASK